MGPSVTENTQTSAVADPKRAAILAAATKLLAEKGYAGLTTLEVARTANISKRDLYARFPTKDELIAGMISDGVKEMLIPVEFGSPNSRAEFYAALAAFGGAFLSAMLSDKRINFYRLAISEVPKNPGIGKALLREGSRATAGRITDFFNLAQKDGYVRFKSVDASVGAFFFALMGDLILSRLLDPDRSVDAAEQRRHVGLALLIVQALDEIKS